MEIKQTTIESSIAERVLTIITDKYAHRIHYTANITDPTAIAIVSFEDEIIKVQNGYLQGLLGHVSLSHGLPLAPDIPLCEDALAAIAEFKQLVALIQGGKEVRV